MARGEERTAAIIRHAHPFEGYRGGETMPLGAFTGLITAYAAAFGAFLAATGGTGRRLPDRIAVRDLLLLGVATHKVSRLITRDWVTAPLRAAFTTYKGSTGAGEVTEQPRGGGLRMALGELLT